MRIEQFYYLQITAQEASIHQASRKLHISPQALSRSLMHLEKELNVKLLDRSRYGIQLTDKGKRLLKAADSFLKELTEISENNQEHLLTLTGDYRLLSTRGLGHFMPNLLAQLYLAVPNLTVQIDYSTYHDILNKIINEHVELALLNLSLNNGQNIYDFDEENLLFYPLKEYRYYCRVSDKLPIATYKTISLKTLLNYPMIIDDPNNGAYSFEAIMRQFGQPRKIIYEENGLLIDEIVNTGLYTAIGVAETKTPLPKASTAGVVHIELADDIKTIFGFVVLKKKILSEKTAAVIQILKGLV